jgi:hypothetical protein
VFNKTLYHGGQVLLVEETGEPGENHEPVIDKLDHIMLYHIIQWVDSLFLQYHVLRTPQKLITNDFSTMKTAK